MVVSYLFKEHGSETAGATSDSPEFRNPRKIQTLLVGLSSPGWFLAHGQHPEKTANIHARRFLAMERSEFRRFSPELVLSNLLLPECDVFDVVDKLSRLGFSGRYAAVADSVPNLEMVLGEVRAHWPMFWFDISRTDRCKVLHGHLGDLPSKGVFVSC